MEDIIYKKILNIAKEENVKKDEPMSKHTSFKVGGKADYFVEIDNNQENILNILKLAKENNVKITIVGNGTNILVSDDGIRGIVLKIKPSTTYNIYDDYIEVSAGTANAYLANVTLNNEMTGFEFAAGIPGTIGGAIVMNAGAFGGEIKNVLYEASGIDINTSKNFTYTNEDCKLGYRTSIFQKKSNLIITSAKIKYSQGKKEEIASCMNEYRERRLNSQPLDMPSAGSTFKRGDGFITAKLIDEAGLKGYSIGGAMVSKKHAGFIVNTGNATAKDIKDLIKYVQDEVYKKFNVKIEPEVKFIG